jgi:serine/threonine-protein kinase
MTSPADRVIGRLIADRYRVIALVGSGGMGEVYRAEHVGLKRLTALKFMRPALGQDADALARFRREAEQASRISHPNVAAIYDFGDTGDGHVFLAMEFIEGESLADRIARQGRLPPTEAAHIILGATAGLAAAHRRGILHRDLKPANIMLTAECGPDADKDPHAVGTVKLVDFGIARSIMGDIKPVDAANATATPSLTRTGMVLGTPAYASPEQLAGEPLDARSDLYALGLIAFETLTGQPAFATTNARELIAHRLLGSPRAVSDVLRGGEAPWADAVQPVLDRALSSDPAKRYTEPMEFAGELAAALGVTPGTPTAFAATTPVGTRDDTPAAPQALPDPRRRTVMLGLAIGGVLLVGAILWKSLARDSAPPAPAASTAATTPAVQRLAVLPFENLGRPEDAYVVDGLTDEIRSKLAGVPGVQVIARSSSNQYRATTKPLQEVARELGVRYVLTGTVRSEAAVGAKPARVRVNPELVEITSSTAAPVSRWTNTLDATMADVFGMQADIAGRVVGAMNVALAGGTRSYLAEVPTHDAAASDAYLRGKEIVKTDPADLRRKLRYFRQAVALDSSFALAWVERSRVAAILFSNGVPDPALAREAKLSAERAIALAPQQGAGYGVLATYRNLVEQNPVTALEAARRAQELSPGDPELLRPLAIAERQQGRVAESLRDMRAAAERDPRNATTVHLLADALLWARRLDEAREIADRALMLAPDVSEMIESRAMISLARGDLAEARRVLAAAPPSVDRAVLAAAVSMYYDLPWLLDDTEQRRLLALGPDAFDGDRMSWAWSLAQTHALRGDAARTRVYAESTVVAVDEQLRSAPDDPQRHLIRGLALAALGRTADAVAAGTHGFALQRQRWTATNGPYAQHQLARIYMMTGDRAKALDLLESLLAMPYFLSPAWLRIDPTFAPLKGDPRFEQLAASAPVVFPR